ncbi:MAG: UDP-N-acetylglucosamine 1-carboxyvinyltransferase [Cryobacterium sp.]|nr:UDP-N-acetylglucosamine 1-carboxyvinyltransferase [Oligoflexia bacterium]
MDKLKIQGGVQLNGTVQVSGAKNAALPILISAILGGGKSRFERVPALQDIKTTELVLNHLGLASTFENGVMTLDATKIATVDAPYDLVRKMRASVLVLGPLLAREGRAKVSLPGGCAIGARPIDFHLSALEKLGAKITLEGGYVIAEAKRLRGNRVAFEFPSVGATENAMMAATLADGETLLENCAKEPEIVDLAISLRSMGAKIEGEGTEHIRIQGVNSLSGANHRIVGDRIEAGTFLAVALATRGKIRVEGLAPHHLEAVLAKFESSGAKIHRDADAITLESTGRARGTDFQTQPFPGFPTDMQAQFMAAMCLADGPSLITETIFENRFMHVPELTRLGADLTIRGNSVLVRGKEKLIAAPVMATDLRASASLVMGGLCAEGETTVSRIYHLDRGYERMEEKLRSLGAKIDRVKDES